MFFLAHELRTPLAAVLSSTYVLHQIDGQGAIARSSVDIIERQAKHMSRVIENVLDVCRITHGKLTLQRQPVELDAVISGAIESVYPLVCARNHQVTVALPNGDCCWPGKLRASIKSWLIFSPTPPNTPSQADRSI